MANKPTSKRLRRAPRILPANHRALRRRRVRHQGCGGEIEGLFTATLSYRLLAVSKRGEPVFDADDPYLTDGLDETLGEGHQPRDFITLYCARCGEEVECDEVRVDPARLPANGVQPRTNLIVMPGAGMGLRGRDLNDEVKRRWRTPKRVMTAKATGAVETKAQASAKAPQRGGWRPSGDAA